MPKNKQNASHISTRQKKWCRGISNKYERQTDNTFVSQRAQKQTDKKNTKRKKWGTDITIHIGNIENIHSTKK